MLCRDYEAQLVNTVYWMFTPDSEVGGVHVCCVPSHSGPLLMAVSLQLFNVDSSFSSSGGHEPCPYVEDTMSLILSAGSWVKRGQVLCSSERDVLCNKTGDGPRFWGDVTHWAWHCLGPGQSAAFLNTVGWTTTLCVTAASKTDTRGHYRSLFYLEINLDKIADLIQTLGLTGLVKNA